MQFDGITTGIPSVQKGVPEGSALHYGADNIH